MSLANGSFKWSFLAQSSSKLISTIVQIILARLLDPNTFGIMAILLVVTSVADAISQCGFGTALIQKKQIDRTIFSTAFWVSILTSLAAYAIIWCTSPFMASFYDMPTLEDYLKVLGIVVVFNSINGVQNAYFMRELCFKDLFKVGMISVVTSGAIGIFCAYSGYGIWSLVAQSLSFSIVTTIALWILLPIKPAFIVKASECAYLFEFGWKLCFSSVINVLYRGISELIIGKFCSPTDLGYYSQGRKYPTAVLDVIVASLSNVFLPLLSKIQDDKQALRKSAERFLGIGNYFMILLSIVLILAARPLIALLLSEKWIPCVPIFQLLCLSYLPIMFELVNLRIYVAVGNTALYLKLNIIKIIVGCCAIFPTAIIFKNIYIVAWTVTIVSLVNILIIDIYPAGRVYGYPWFRQIQDQLSAFFTGAVSFGLSYLTHLLPLNYNFQVALQICLFLLVFFLLSKGLSLIGFQYIQTKLSAIMRSKAK